MHIKFFMFLLMCAQVCIASDTQPHSISVFEENYAGLEQQFTLTRITVGAHDCLADVTHTQANKTCEQPFSRTSQEQWRISRAEADHILTLHAQDNNHALFTFFTELADRLTTLEASKTTEDFVCTPY